MKNNTNMKALLFICIGLLTLNLNAQLTAWKTKIPIEVTENEGVNHTNYQILLKLNTQALIAAGQMKSDAGDLRFAADCQGNILLDFFIETGINTDSTIVWVKMISLAANATETIYMFYSNSAATTASNFDNTFPPATRLILPTGTTNLNNQNTYSWFEIGAAGTAVIDFASGSSTIKARKIIIAGTVSGNGFGYLGGTTLGESGGGPGGGKGGGGTGYGGGGAGYGGVGGMGGYCSTCTNPALYGTGGAVYGTTNAQTFQIGAGGGASLTSGGAGGGALRLTAAVVDITGIINVNGDNGSGTGILSAAGGGGAGGGVLIEADYALLNSGTINSKGGNGGSAPNAGGGGAGGRVKIFHDKYYFGGTYDVSGGLKGVKTNITNIDAQDGFLGTTFDTIFSAKEPTYNFLQQLTVTFSNTNTSCNGVCDGASTVTPNGGETPYTYQWAASANSQTTQTASGLCAGTHNITVTDNNSCTVDTFTTITEPPAITITTSSTNASCGGINNGTATATASGGSGTFTYQWDSNANNQTTSTATGLAAGTYSVTATDGTGCTQTATVAVSQAGSPTLTTSSTPVTCNGGNDGTATVTASGGSSPYGYLWSSNANNQTTSTATGLSAGTYTVTVTDMSSCFATASVTVTEPTKMNLTTSTQDDICQSSIGEATVTPSGGTSPYTYLWDANANNQTTQTATGLAAGTYYVTVTDNNGCIDSTSTTVNNSSDISMIAASTTESCFGACDGTASVTAVNPFPPYTYQWNDPNNQTTQTATGLCSNTYTVTVTDFTGCQDSISIFVNTPPQITLQTSSTPVSCNGGNNGTATVTPSGGSGVFTYMWDNNTGNQTTQTATGLIAGTFGVTVTDTDGCSEDTTVTVTQPGALTLTMDSTAALCNGQCSGTATANASSGTTPYTYQWSASANNQTTKTATGLCAGTHNVTVSDAYNCTITRSVQILQPASPLIVNADSTNINCNAGNNGTATANATGGTTPYSYLWSNSQTTQTITGLTAGTYKVTVTDNNGCTATDSTIVNQPPVLTVSVTSTNENCSDSSGTATATPTGGVSPYTYAWSNSQTTQTATGLTAGTYTVTVTDANGCSATASATVTNSGLTLTKTTSSTQSCFSNSTGSATVTVTSGGTSPYTYLWNDPNNQTTTTATGLAGGNYIVTVTDQNGCSDTVQVAVGTRPKINLAPSSVSPSCNGGSDGTATVTASNGNTPYSYQWAANASNQTTQTATGLAAGSYSVTVTDNAGCTQDTVVVVNQPAALSTTTSSTAATCNGTCNGQATATPSGGTTPYSYSWTNGQTTQTSTGLCAGMTYVTVTDSKGCTKTDSANVSQPPVLAVTTSGNNVSCFSACNGTGVANATGGTTPYTYNWSNGQTNQTATGLCAGTYTVTVTDKNGCTATATRTVTQPASSISLTTSKTNPSCSGTCDGTGTAAASGGVTPYTYAWSNGQTTSTATALCAGNYTVTVTDNSGCNKDTSITLTAPSAITVTFTKNDAACGQPDGDATANVSGGTSPYTYQWAANAGSQTTQTATGLAAGTYSITVTDNNGCTKTGMVSINNVNGPTLAKDSIGVSCYGASDGTAIINASGGTTPYTYLWDSSTGSQTTSSATGLAAGTYSVTVTDDVGCQASDFVEVIQPDSLSISKSVTNVTCKGGNNGSVALTVSGGTTAYSYTWSDGQTTSTASGLSAGTYYITVTDANNCSKTDSAVVTEPASIVTVNIVINSHVKCNGQSNGSLTANPSGGNSPYAYLWSNGSTSQTITGLAAGTYNVTIADANGCNATDSKTVNQPATLTVTATGTNSTCANSDGSATATVSGGTSPYTYAWSDGQSTSTATGLAPGSYSVTVTDSLGCNNTASVTINSVGGPNVSLTSANPSCFGDCNGTISATVSGGTSPYSYNWSDGKTVANNTGLCAGTYSITVTDAASCSTIQSTTLTQPSSALAASVTSTNASAIGACDGSASVTATGGTSPYAYLWSNSATTATITGLCAGQYCVTVTDSKGCTVNSCTTVTEVGACTLTATTSSTDAACGASDGTATVSASGGDTPYTYNWSNGQTTSTATGLAQGSYSVTVTDSSACTVTVSATVNNAGGLTATLSATDETCNASNGAVTANPSGGTPPYSYTWSNGGSTQSITGLSAGTYILTVTDDAGCKYNASATVNSTGAISISLSSVDELCGNANGAATVAVSGGTTPYTYSWSNGGSSSSITGLSAGSYSVTVTDSNGCINSDSVAVGNTPGPTVSTVKADELCNQNNASATAIPTGGNSPFTYIWSDAQTTQMASGLSAGTYTVTVTDNNNCTATATATINSIGGPSLSVAFTNDYCSQAIGTAMATAASGTSPYAYNWNTGNTNSTLTGLASGVYSVTVTDANNCYSVGSGNISNVAGPDVTAASVAVSCEGISDGQISAMVSGGTSPYLYCWSSTSSCNTDSVITMVAAGEHTITVTDSKGCSDSVKVMVENGTDGCLNIPTVFTPNGDGKNDTWKIRGLENMPPIKIEVYNRWGALVFSSNGYSVPWDGKHNGAELPSAAYYYIITFEGGESTSGTITIVR